jgi:hypothetical protein
LKKRKQLISDLLSKANKNSIRDKSGDRSFVSDKGGDPKHLLHSPKGPSFAKKMANVESSGMVYLSSKFRDLSPKKEQLNAYLSRFVGEDG